MFSGPNNSGVATITGTAKPDQFAIQLNPTDATMIELSDNGGASFTDAALSGITSIVVDGLQGRDTLTLNEGNGLVALAAGLPITFNGGPGRDALIVEGSPSGTIKETFTPGTTAGSSTLDITDGTLSSTVTLSSVARIRDTMTADTLTINADDNNNVIHLHNGPLVNGVQTDTVHVADVQQIADDVDDSQEGDQTATDDDGDQGMNDRQSDNSQGDDNGQGDDNHQGDDNGQGDDEHEGGTSFPSLSFANKTNVVINGLGGDDLFVVNVSKTAAGLKNLTLDGGSGTNVLAARNFPPGVTVTQTNIQKQVSDPDDIFIEEMFEERLDRPAGSQEVAAWKAVLNSPAGQAGVALGIEQSPEARTLLVKQMYTRYLGRQAVHGEEQGWVNALVRGTTEEAVLTAILASPEFYARAQTLVTSGTADQRFIQAMYQTLLNRPALPAEVSGWVAVLPTIGRVGVAMGFVESNEFRAGTIAAFYATFLQRSADQAGLNGWVTSGLDLGHVREAIEASPEFMQRG
jgi:hypothetical protein